MTRENTAAAYSSVSEPLDTERGAPRTRALRFHGRTMEALGIALVNALLTALTLGGYYAWGKARLRRYLWSKIDLDGHALSFHGTGWEMFVGWIKVVAVFAGALGSMVIAQLVFGKNSAIPLLMMGLYYLGLLFILPFIIVAARRYLLSRTEWNGNRFSFRGDATEFARIFLKGFLFTMLSFGFYGPINTSNVYGYLVRNSYYGTRRFNYEGDGRDLMLPYVKAFFLAFVTFGISLLYYSARQLRYLHSRTTFTSARFDSTVTGGRLFWLVLTTMLLIFVPYVTVMGAGFGVGLASAGAGSPTAMLRVLWVLFPVAFFTLSSAVVFAMIRVTRFHVENLVVRGEIDYATIGAGSDSGANATGESMASAFDIGGGLSL